MFPCCFLFSLFNSFNFLFFCEFFSAKLETQEPAVKKKKCTRRSSPKTKVKVASTLMKKEPDSYDELDFSFPNTVHQDDEFGLFDVLALKFKIDGKI